jgi:ABC-type transporter Mla MlaB component
MPREMTRQSARQDAAVSHLDIEVTSKDMTARVALSGLLDQVGLERLISQVAPRLSGLGYRVILDGTGLVHLDYRTTRSLIRWNRNLRQFRHQLYLQNWNNYLKAILCMEDWERELGLPLVLPSGSNSWGQSADRGVI